MVKKVSKRVKTLSGFMKWIEQFSDGQYLFRGVSKHTYKLEASAYRRLPEKERNNPNKLLKINQELIDKARLLGHDQKDGLKCIRLFRPLFRKVKISFAVEIP